VHLSAITLLLFAFIYPMSRESIANFGSIFKEPID